MPNCAHTHLAFEPSAHAAEAGFVRASPAKLSAAAQPNGKPLKSTSTRTGYQDVGNTSTFPQPLVLPGDDLALDPDYEPQTLKSWIEEPERNEVTKIRRTIYVAEVPSISPSCPEVASWSQPNIAKPKAGPRDQTDIPKPKCSDVRSYLKAFYHPLPTKTLPKSKSLEFVPWTDDPETYIGLKLGSSQEVIGIRHRPSLDGIFSGQLNLDDLLDAAITLLPKDAYALLLLVDHDLYEDEEDDFCCGRAYGGSRVAVVSSARYNPNLDEMVGLEREHAWPASHFEAYIDRCLGKKRVRGKTWIKNPLQDAVDAFNSSPPIITPLGLSNLWLSRVCKTASHELGHCFGMDHCVFYSCIMQGTAGLEEDSRQPPYLCPVDLKKVLHAVGARNGGRERCEELRKFCEVWGEKEGGGMWRAWGKWLEGRVGELEE
ncbi:Archaemetzincin-2 [Pseudocercospora fuligena]|uniref:Archaemetzincin-2 n=1 Tax=Pseudocercospora fuligena TaxID=685502 RepID=A0A8H6RHA0_9PEZI|nr:Archaemetzincin-2 [Pseudocercospora fuligena]